MTAETVMAQGGAVLEECADENCVITLGSKIGADYIVRGTVSKLGAKFTLQVEMYETENGNLVASCDPVRAESIEELVEKAAEACATMYKAWLASQAPEPEKVAEKLRKRYIGVNYMITTPVTSTGAPSMNNITYQWVGIEYGWMTGFDLFFGVEAGLGFALAGFDGHDDFGNASGTYAWGGSLDAGYAFRFPASFTLSTGGSVGFWIQEYWDMSGYSTNEEFSGVVYPGLFIKARWKNIVVSYKGIIGYTDNENNGIRDDEHWHWVNQVKAGVYVEF